METKLNRTGVACYAPVLTAALALAITLAFNACGGDSGNEDGGSISGISSSVGTSSSSNGSSSSGGDRSSSSGSSSSSNTSSSSSNTVSYADKGNSIASYSITEPIGGQIWMAENLNYKVEGSRCYGEGYTTSATEIQANCDKYGRLYDWATAMNLPPKCNSALSASDADCAIETPHRGICPSGWHIPGNDWAALYSYVFNSKGLSENSIGKYLKATSGWHNNGNGTDDFGFKALPGGLGIISPISYFSEEEISGYWWGSSKDDTDAGKAFFWNMDHDDDEANPGMGDKSYLLSVRCLKD
ncbi:MAG: hypothetical protein LBH25_12740 [Fibromonadaceae bacterium]|jgi:uncharacterized protein (TIGR02145 family)|nr:hypothetical protein [Fibromonadaceae bacterium]